MRRRRRTKDSVSQDRWLVSYADFMTLLFALFVVLFASTYRDSQAIKKVSDAVKSGFVDLGAFTATSSKSTTPGADHAQKSLSVSNGVDPVELNRKLSKALGKEIERQEVNLRMTPEGFVISLHELGFFDSGKAELKPGATEKVKKIASVLTQYGLDMRVEGHSDNIPIHNGAFNSNWELSTARATAVAMMLIKEAGIDPKTLSIAGYGQYHPAASNDTQEGRASNRRVDIVIISSYVKPLDRKS
jgi:chemotaxis protein MotB